MNINQWVSNEPENYISIILDVSISTWGTEIKVVGMDDPVDQNTYIVVFKQCQQIIWDLVEPDEDDLIDEQCDLIGFDMGEGNYKKPAVINCGFFEICILYGFCEIEYKEKKD